MKELIERLKSLVKLAEKDGEDMDSVSWGMQEGILISYNEAKRIIALKEALEELVQVKDWKDKHGKDEHYKQAQPIVWRNAKAALDNLTPEIAAGGIKEIKSS